MCLNCGEGDTRFCSTNCESEYYGVLDEVLDPYIDPITARRNQGDDMLYPTYNIFGEWES